jgi:hypothetical protein
MDDRKQEKSRIHIDNKGNLCLKLIDMRLFSLTFILALLFYAVVFTAVSQEAQAATLTSASDTITTSRPSPSSPLNAALGSTDTQATIFNNGSRYLASDSAKLIRKSTDTLLDTSTIVASQSSALTTVFFSEQAGTAGQAGTDVLFVPITAMHRVAFTVVGAVPNTGDIFMTFPNLATGDSNNEASPSATTFQMNNLDADDVTLIKVLDDDTDITANTTISLTNPTGNGDGADLTITIDTGSIAAGSVVEIFIGCSTVGGGTCTAQTPRVINPTKTAAAGTADTWKIAVQTRNGSDVLIDSATVAVATIDSVQILATVDPTLTFTIAGVGNGVDVNTGNTTGCLQDEDTNAGTAATATVVNLGILGNTPTAVDTKVSNIAAQLLTVTTNGSGGYSLTATSAGQLRDFSSGFAINSSTTPTAFPASAPRHWFGFHACGLDTYNATIGTTFWNTTASNTECGSCISGSTTCPDSTPGTNVCKYGWPTTTTSLTLASDSTGPIGTASDGNGLVSVSYASGVDANVPGGSYQTYVTYVATATF